MEVRLGRKERTMTMLDEETGVLDRFRAPLYTVREAARYLDVPERTFATWAYGYRHQSTRRRMVVGLPVLTTLPKTGRRGPVIPFIGLAEGLVLTAMRRSGVPCNESVPPSPRWTNSSDWSTRSRASDCIPTGPKSCSTMPRPAPIPARPGPHASLSSYATASGYLTRSSSRTCVESSSVTTVTPG